MQYCPFCISKIEEKEICCTRCGKHLDVQNGEHELPIGTILTERYYVGKALRQGGFGITYVGCDSKLDKKIAIKEYFPVEIVSRVSKYSTAVSLTAEDQADNWQKEKNNFIREAHVLAEFAGERNIVSVTDIVSEHNTAYIIMEFIEGLDMDEYLTINGLMTFRDAYAMLEPLILTLERVHQRGLIHQDISPSNIKILPDKTAVLLDFGAAREYADDDRSKSVILKPGYAPLEQYRSRGRRGPETDVYAICATLYKMITGNVPDNALDRIDGASIRRPSELGADISPEEERVLMTGLAVRQKDRIQTMAELNREIAITHRSFSSEDKTELLYQNRQEKTYNHRKRMNVIVLAAAGVGIAVVLTVICLAKRKNTFTGEDEAVANMNVMQEDQDADIFLESTVVMKGDAVGISFVDNGFVIFNQDDLKFMSSDERIASIEYDTATQRYFLRGNNTGEAEVVATCNGKRASAQVYVGNLDESYGITLQPLYNMVFLDGTNYSDKTSELMFTLTGCDSEEVLLNYYFSEGLSIKSDGKWEGNKLIIELSNYGSYNQDGTMTVLISDVKHLGTVYSENVIDISIR